MSGRHYRCARRAVHGQLGRIETAALLPHWRSAGPGYTLVFGAPYRNLTCLNP